MHSNALVHYRRGIEKLQRLLPQHSMQRLLVNVNLARPQNHDKSTESDPNCSNIQSVKVDRNDSTVISS